MVTEKEKRGGMTNTSRAASFVIKGSDLWGTLHRVLLFEP